MDDRKESLADVMNRVFETPAQRSTHVVRPAPPITHAPGCGMSDRHKEITRQVVVIWLKLADCAMSLMTLIVKHEAVAPEEARIAMEKTTQLIERLPAAGAADADHKLRKLRSNLASVQPWDAPTKKIALEMLNHTLDAMKPFDGVVSAVAKYCLKLQGAQLSIDRTFDLIEDIQFSRELADELALMAME
jgi:hypothetical protein